MYHAVLSKAFSFQDLNKLLLYKALGNFIHSFISFQSSVSVSVSLRSVNYHQKKRKHFNFHLAQCHVIYIFSNVKEPLKEVIAI